jgi:hypothetical protein
MGRQAVIALGIIAVLIAVLFFATQLGRLRPAKAADGHAGQLSAYRSSAPPLFAKKVEEALARFRNSDTIGIGHEA